MVTAGLMIYIKTLQSKMAMPGMAWNPLKKQAGQLAAKPLLTQVFALALPLLILPSLRVFLLMRKREI